MNTHHNLTIFTILQFNPIPRFTTFNVRTNVWSEGPPMLEAR